MVRLSQLSCCRSANTACFAEADISGVSGGTGAASCIVLRGIGAMACASSVGWYNSQAVQSAVTCDTYGLAYGAACNAFRGFQLFQYMRSKDTDQ
jgi:hypothetical protein